MIRVDLRIFFVEGIKEYFPLTKKCGLTPGEDTPYVLATYVRRKK